MKVQLIPNEWAVLLKNNLAYIVSSVFTAAGSYSIDLVVVDQWLGVILKAASIIVACFTVIKIITEWRKKKTT